MANSKLRKRKVITGLFLAFVAFVVSAMVLHLKFVAYKSYQTVDKSQAIGAKVINTDAGKSMFIISGGYDAYRTFKLDLVRIVPIGFQKYRIYIDAHKENVTTDAIRLPLNIHIHMALTRNLPRGKYELITNITGTNTVRLNTMDNEPPEKRVAMKSHRDVQYFVVK